MTLSLCIRILSISLKVKRIPHFLDRILLPLQTRATTSPNATSASSVTLQLQLQWQQRHPQIHLKWNLERGTHTVGKSQVSNGKAMGGGKGRRVNVTDA